MVARKNRHVQNEHDCRRVVEDCGSRRTLDVRRVQEDDVGHFSESTETQVVCSGSAGTFRGDFELLRRFLSRLPAGAA